MALFNLNAKSNLAGKFAVLKENPVCPVFEMTKKNCEECLHPYCGNPGSLYNQLHADESEGDDE